MIVDAALDNLSLCFNAPTIIRYMKILKNKNLKIKSMVRSALRHEKKISKIENPILLRAPFTNLFIYTKTVKFKKINLFTHLTFHS